LQSNTKMLNEVCLPKMREKGRTHDVDIEGNNWKEVYEFVTMEDVLARFTISADAFTHANLQNKQLGILMVFNV